MNRLKGEFEKQRAIVMLFPARKDVWRHDCAPIRRSMVELANILSEHVPVIMGVLPALMDVAKNEYSFSSGVKLVKMKYNDCWSRDSISSVVSGERPYISAFEFNAYGGELYFPWDDDNRLDNVIAKEFKYPIKRSPLTLEGGNMLPDGAGTLFAVKDAIVNDNRNPDFSLEQIETLLKEATASEQIVWIEQGLVGDETGGHIDNVMTLADHNTILLSWTDDESNPQYKVTHEIGERLSRVKNTKGEPYRIVHVPVPELYYRTDDDSDSIEAVDGSFPRKEGDAVLETYVNIALSNGIVVVPQFGSPLDAEALAIISSAFPDRKVVGLDGREATLGGGGFHCLTKHIH